MPFDPKIIDRGRGPEISGTRITVYDILDYSTQGWHHTLIAATLRISSREVLVALEYIESHKCEVMAAYEEILERSARGNSPEIQAKLVAAHERVEEFLKQRRAESKERADAAAGSAVRR